MVGYQKMLDDPCHVLVRHRDLFKTTLILASPSSTAYKSQCLYSRINFLTSTDGPRRFQQFTSALPRSPPFRLRLSYFATPPFLLHLVNQGRRQPRCEVRERSVRKSATYAETQITLRVNDSVNRHLDHRGATLATLLSDDAAGVPSEMEECRRCWCSCAACGIRGSR